MKTIIAGSRTITEYSHLLQAIAVCGWTPSLVLSGTAKGVDRLGEMWAIGNKVPLKRYPADWNTYGKSAGYRRNEEMAERAEALLAIWDTKSKGTQHMISVAGKKNLRIFIWEVV